MRTHTHIVYTIYIYMRTILRGKMMEHDDAMIPIIFP